MRNRVRLISTGFVACFLAGAWGCSQAEQPGADGFISLAAEEMEGAEPDEDGIVRVYVTGHPDEPGMYVVRNTFPAGQTSRPHFHDQDRYVTVIRGTWWTALGEGADVYAPETMVPVEAGGFVKHPAGGVHYDGAKDEAVVVQIIGMGPVRTTRLE